MRNIQRHEALRGFSATAEFLLLDYRPVCGRGLLCVACHHSLFRRYKYETGTRDCTSESATICLRQLLIYESPETSIHIILSLRQTEWHAATEEEIGRT